MSEELAEELLARPFAMVRESCAEVAARARLVSLDPVALERFAQRVPLAELGRSGGVFPALGGDTEALAAFVLCLDSVNFGSGWFPHLVKLTGHSGYRTLESRLRARFEARGPFTVRELRGFEARSAAELFAQPLTPPLDELMALFARALRDLGEQVSLRAGGSFAGFVEEAGGSAAALVRSLLTMPLYRDVARHDGQLVAFLKRAQIAVSDLAHVLPEGLGRFRDLDELTIFADNLVPHVLRLDGVLRFDRELVARIDAGITLASGSPEEVEIRACAVDAVEQIAARIRARGSPVLVRDLDNWLWLRGGEPQYKARPRHRTRCPYY
jgi:hypothetical protein